MNNDQQMFLQLMGHIRIWPEHRQAAGRASAESRKLQNEDPPCLIEQLSSHWFWNVILLSRLYVLYSILQNTIGDAISFSFDYLLTPIGIVFCISLESLIINKTSSSVKESPQFPRKARMRNLSSCCHPGTFTWQFVFDFKSLTKLGPKFGNGTRAFTK